MKKIQAQIRKKILLITGILLVGITLGIFWFLGVRIEHVRSLIQYFSGSPELSVEETAELHTWLKENAVHLNTLETGSGFDDMQPLKAVIGDARIVALGEAAHCNGSFSRVKHRMVEFLVNEMDFTVFAIEATFPGALELNDYILTGDGDPERALGALVYAAWNTEEILAMVKWMCQYNSTHEKKIKFYGFDVRVAGGSAEAVYNYLRKINGSHDFDKLLSVLMNPWTADQFRKSPKEEKYSAKEEIETLITYLENNKPVLNQKTPSEQNILEHKQWSLAVKHARVLLQYIEFRSLLPSRSKATDFRDKGMAENVRWLVDYEKGAKIILWAANAHVLTTRGSGCMGDYLRRAFGKDMVVFGLLNNRNSAGLLPDDTDQDLGAPKRSVEALLAEAGLDMAVVNLRSLPKGAVSKYFNAPRKTGPIAYLLPSAYDAILFIESTVTAIQAKGGSIRETVERLPEASNLDFEEIEDGRLRDWQIQSGRSRVEYQTTGSHEQPYKGATCGMIKRVPGKAFGEACGNITQSLKADDFRGQTIQFNAAVRAVNGIAYLWLSIDARNAPNIFRQEIITSDKWQKYSISAKVPQEAFRISYGLAYVGQGAAFIDDVTIGNSIQF
ncbi:MAG: erythromycin esterase family protein [Planctomycetes bacterium]|nr:erythromycin esterase family protein [Planctomycetota bacterium]MBL7145663.1 erythromycin esterase family protein [Phycisphaerae bacterium]